MGASRRFRAAGESTFLEHIKDVLYQLQADVETIKFSIANGYARDVPLYPPPPAPPLEKYDRNVLLRYRSSCDVAAGLTLPDTISLDALDFSMKQAARDEQDEQLMEFLRAQGHYDDDAPNDLAKLITEAQSMAAMRRQQEDMAASSIAGKTLPARKICYSSDVL